MAQQSPSFVGKYAIHGAYGYSIAIITLWLFTGYFNIAMENDPFIDDFPINTSIYGECSMAMLNNQMVSLQLNAIQILNISKPFLTPP